MFAINDNGQPHAEYKTNAMTVDRPDVGAQMAASSPSNQINMLGATFTPDAVSTEGAKDGKVTITWAKVTGDLANAANYRFILASEEITTASITEEGENWVVVIDGMYAKNYLVVVEQFEDATLTGGAVARSFKTVTVA